MIINIPIVEILRFESTQECGTFGKMRINKVAFFDTLEPYNRNNKKNESCIPVGMMLCKRVKSPKFGDTFEITSVEGRDSILFHWGSFVKNTNGCIMVGNGLSIIDNKRAIINSKRSFREFLEFMVGVDEFILVISEHY